MSTLLSYLAAVGRPDGAARLVWAGHEPQQFINLFPEWSQREDVRLFNAKVSRGEKQGGGGRLSYTMSVMHCCGSKYLEFRSAF